MNSNTVLEGYSDLEKGAYLAAIASLATADREASEEELEYISALCDASGISESQKDAVLSAANELSGEELQRCLDTLKDSELKYSLVADIIAFSKADQDYSEEEQHRVEEISKYLGVDKKQFSLLDEFADKAAASDAPVEEKTSPTFLSSLGLSDKMNNAGINSGGLLKGLIGIAAPLILSRMFSGRGSRRGGGGMLGNLGGIGGIGSIIGMLSGGRGFGNAGGLLGKLLGGRRF